MRATTIFNSSGAPHTKNIAIESMGSVLRGGLSKPLARAVIMICALAKKGHLLSPLASHFQIGPAAGVRFGSLAPRRSDLVVRKYRF